jgi:hypothetical protein
VFVHHLRTITRAAVVSADVGLVWGGLLHPAVAGVSQVRICHFGGGGGRGFVFEG